MRCWICAATYITTENIKQSLASGEESTCMRYASIHFDNVRFRWWQNRENNNVWHIALCVLEWSQFIKSDSISSIRATRLHWNGIAITQSRCAGCSHSEFHIFPALMTHSNMSSSRDSFIYISFLTTIKTTPLRNVHSAKLPRETPDINNYKTQLFWCVFTVHFMWALIAEFRSQRQTKFDKSACDSEIELDFRLCDYR